MKILAIRGENLASLPRFELDLGAGPLGEAGLFAIAGPTGAGKSTLLDALCLALYDTTPRLRGEGPQHILRQSAVEAYAEVDFRCDQRRRYRATWRIQRARKKPDGRWQEQTLQLVDLETGKQLGDHRKRETLRLIEEHVGLSFDQFRRAVLLAQGDFALFLQAKGDERAKLLEKITGAEIYARISEAAFRRCKEERERLAGLRAEAERYPVLGDEERAQREADRERLRLLRAELGAQVEARKRECEWHRTRGRLGAELAQAEAELLAARGRWDEGAALREEIGAYERALALRPALLGAEAAGRRAREAAAEHEAAAQRLGRAAEAGDQARAGLGAAERALGEARAQQAERAPEIARARELELRIDALAERLLEATEEARAAAAALDGERRREAAVAGRIIEGGRRAAELDGWLAERAALGAVAAQWPRWRGELRGAGAAWRRLCALERDGGGRERRLQQAEAAAQGAQAARREAEERRREARQALEAARAQLAAYEEERPQEALARRREELAARLQRVAEARRLAAELARTGEELAAAQAQARDEASRGEACRVAADGARQALDGARRERDECERDLAVLRATQELAARRPELLAPGQPCPLCGAREHPHADQPAPAAAGVRRLQEQLAALRARADQLKEREAELRQEGHARGVIAAQAQARARSLDGTRRGQGEALGALLIDVGLGALREGAAPRRGAAMRQGALPFALDDDAETPRGAARQGALPFALDDQAEAQAERALAAAERAIREEQAALDAQAQAGEALRREHARRGEAQGRAAEELECRAADDAAAATERAAAERALALHREQLQSARELWQRSAEGLEGALAFRPRWREELGASTEALEEALGRDVEAWEERSRRRAQAEDEARALQGQLLQSQQALQLLGEAQRQKQAQREGCAAELEQLRRDRGALLGGRGARDCAAELECAAARADEALGRARALAAAAQEERAAAEEAVATARRRLGQAEEERRQAQAQLAAAAAAAGLPEEALRQALSCDEAVHDARRRRLQALREALTEAEVRVADRRRRLDAHGETAAPSLPQRECEAALADEGERLDAAANELFHIELTLSQDEQTRASRARAEEGVAARQAQVEAWERLSDLIGSADGKKFRQFAQSLTLDVLLEHTNHHLRQLRPRYRIERVRGADMDLQVVDRDMGGEVRSCATLSGGESFLVSLALALGLSSLSSRDVRVESLFIDEGFGTLDRDTLELAIATLEQLQADGRQVGLISHVSELADRIGYQVLVRPRHAGHSTVTISDGRR